MDIYSAAMMEGLRDRKSGRAKGLERAERAAPRCERVVLLLPVLAAMLWFPFAYLQRIGDE